MLAIERREKILTILQAQKRVVVSNLSETFKVSEETIRRDLEKLDAEGLAKKTYGGAVLKDNTNTDMPYTTRKNVNVEKKLVTAELAAELIQDGDYLMLDSSSTAIFVIKRIKHKKNITIITNSIEAVLEAAEVQGWKVFCTGGSLKEGNLSLYGYNAESMIETFHVDISIVSCKGMDLENGFTDSNEMDAHIKKCMLKSATTKIVVADSTKFDKVSFIKSFDFEDLDTFITDEEPSDEWKKRLKESNIQYIYPKKK